MNLVTELQKQIKEIETRIAEQQGDVQALKSLLNRLRVQEFEEDLREQGNKQLLQE